jgi:hypothetical protein
VFFSGLFILTLRKTEKKYNIYLVRILGRNYPGPGAMKRLISKTTDLKLKNKCRQILLYYYLIYIMFLAPILMVILVLIIENIYVD